MIKEPLGSSREVKRILSPMLAYSFLFFFLAFGDALLSYSLPVIIENTVKNAFFLGLILSTSSVFGIFFDFFTSRIWPNAKYSFFLKLTFITTISLPIILILFPDSILIYLVVMALWGAYYEFRGFASYAFIQKHVTTDQHTSSWATLNAFSAIAYLVGPLVAVLLLDISNNFVLSVSLGTFFLATAIYLSARKKLLGDKGISPIEEKTYKRSTLEQIKIVATLFKSVWHLFTFTFALYMIDSAFWSIGILYTEKLKDSDKLGNLFIVAYMIPSVFTAFIAPRIPKEWSKKRASFIAGILAGVILIFVTAFKSTPIVLLTVLLMAIFYDLSIVLNTAVFEDYVARLGKFGNDMAGVSQAAVSLAYIIGPIVWGWAAEVLDYQKAFALSGVLLASVCTACLVSVPRKVHMPQTALNEI